MLERQQLGLDKEVVNVVNVANMTKATGKRDGKDRPPIGIKPVGKVYDLIETICSEQERPRAFIANKLLMRGLALYLKDQKLTDPAAETFLREMPPESPAGKIKQIEKPDKKRKGGTDNNNGIPGA